ncbi:MAG: hypothetical protein BGN84_06725 [Afipia sp. 62-7]|nr:hypothetical protein [Afipia sp.]OJU21008.1 MAG: hypothetical protein BGN84_06725 [Afipia sp. 62-7]
MSIKTKIAALAVAAIALTGGITATTQQAQAGGFHHHHGHGLGIGVGLAAGALFAAAAANNAYAYDAGYRRCGWVPRYNAYGDYIGRVRTCY